MSNNTFPESYQNLSESCIDMIFFKLARIACGNHLHTDHIKDISGYAWILYEEQEYGKYSQMELEKKP